MLILRAPFVSGEKMTNHYKRHAIWEELLPALWMHLVQTNQQHSEL